jgi:hypothetical protein
MESKSSIRYLVLILLVFKQRYYTKTEFGRAMAQVVSCRPLTAEARVRVQVNPCGSCDGQSGTGTGFSPSSSVFPCQYIIQP